MDAPTQKDTRAHADIEPEVDARVENASSAEAEALTDTTHAGQRKDPPDEGSLAGLDDGDGDLPPGTKSGDYVIREKIGWGGCSTVYAGVDPATGREVAIKVMHRGLAESPKQVQRFVQEAQAVRLIQHPTIVEVYDIGRLEDNRPYIVMELLHGINLASLLRNQGRLSPAEAFEILEPVCAALAVAHESGIVHRDIKASNIIILESQGDERRVKLLDFGIAKLVGSFGSGSMQTTIGHVLGTPHSMAPEQIKGKAVDGRTDVYALGALLYRLLTGRHPFEGCDALALTRMHLHAAPPLPSRFAPVQPALDAVVRKCMEKDPARRYQDVKAFIDGLRDAVGTQRRETVSRALGIYVEGRIDDEQEPDDAIIDDLMTVLDTAERIFAQHAFSVPLITSNSVLGALVVPEGQFDGHRQRVMDVAAELDQEIALRIDADARVSVNVCLHLDEARVRHGTDQDTVIGGPIVDIGAWAPRQIIDGVCATPETLGMSATDGERTARSYVRIVVPRALRFT
jgi:eukaryotic-like serine/threonine-protein kinase